MVLTIRLQPADVGKAGLQGFPKVKKQGARGDKARLIVLKAEAGEGSNAEMVGQNAECGSGIEIPIGAKSDRHLRVQAAKLIGKRRRTVWEKTRSLAIGTETFRRREPGQFIGPFGPGNIRGLELAGGKIDPGKPDRSFRQG